MDLEYRIEQLRERCERALDARLPSPSGDVSRLHEAMRYSVLNGGKRLRPLLVYATGELFGIAPGRLDAAAAAVEMIHSYSLVHDDLPAMDDDDLRRGKPTTHRAFDEATAILVGDALQMLAFDILATDPALGDARTRNRMVATLATAGGAAGMTGGQALDLAAENRKISLAELENIHALKTGRLIRASVLLGAEASPLVDAATRDRLSRFGDCIGLAFQVRDDLLDIEGDTQTLGKPQGSDIALGKATFPALLGIEASRERLDALHAEALDALEGFGGRAALLHELADRAIRRDR
ncbi:MAG: polyprenyl synthetase family protein [Gammaproteobacteria bacterium]|nr:polyprenyl synthetase family protein [Gammaproteobacteria bacterium]